MRPTEPLTKGSQLFLAYSNAYRLDKMFHVLAQYFTLLSFPKKQVPPLTPYFPNTP